MKFIATLFSCLILFQILPQKFKLSSEPKLMYSSIKANSVQSEINGQWLVHGSDEIEIVDIPSGKAIFKWDPKGGYGTSYISHGGKLVANHSQNYQDPKLGFVDVYQVFNTQTKKEYLRMIPNELWTTTGFANTRNEVAIQTYNLTTNLVELIRYDFETDQIKKTLFSTDKSSTVILDIEYSKDDQYIYASIATNASTSTFYVFDVNGKVIAKTPLIHQADKIFILDKEIMVSGAHGTKGTDHTTVISNTDYSIKKELKDIRIDNLSPNGDYSIIYNWDNNSIMVLDIKSGTKELLIDAKEMNLYPLASCISSDGNYFAIGKSNPMEYYKNNTSGKYEAAYIFDNSLVPNPTTSVTTENIDTEEEEEEDKTNNNAPITKSDTWKTYTSKTPSFSVLIPGDPTVKESITSNNRATLTITSGNKTEACVISTIELNNIKTSKYEATAEKLAADFLKKKNPAEIKKGSFSYEGQKGLEDTFKIDKFMYKYRVICYNGYAYQLFYLAEDLSTSELEKFFTSFKILK